MKNACREQRLALFLSLLSLFSLSSLSLFSPLWRERSENVHPHSPWHYSPYFHEQQSATTATGELDVVLGLSDVHGALAQCDRRCVSDLLQLVLHVASFPDDAAHSGAHGRVRRSAGAAGVERRVAPGGRNRQDALGRDGAGGGQGSSQAGSDGARVLSGPATGRRRGRPGDATDGLPLRASLDNDLVARLGRIAVREEPPAGLCGRKQVEDSSAIYLLAKGREGGLGRRAELRRRHRAPTARAILVGLLRHVVLRPERSGRVERSV